MIAMQSRRQLQGVQCPHCGCKDSTVIQTRRRRLPRVNGRLLGGIHRQRACERCGVPYWTTETLREDETKF